ncbi:MAG: hypothetical protein PVH29_06085 [Candidatus Zixiibacteriota bacterium]|jgi:hypothetical protein
MRQYDSPEMYAKAVAGLRLERRRLIDEAAALKGRYETVLRRFKAGQLPPARAAKMAFAIYDRMIVLRHELIPLINQRLTALALEYVRLTSSGNGRRTVVHAAAPAHERHEEVMS